MKDGRVDLDEILLEIAEREAGTYKQLLELKEKENAELKRDLEELTITDNSQRVISDKNEQISFLVAQLTRAKEIISELLSWERRADYDYAEYDLIKDEAEQFLKDSEVEK